MSGHRDVIGVIQDPDSRKVVLGALEAGWQWIGYTKGGHVELRWPETDTRIHVATTPSDTNAWKQLARTIKKVSGVQVVEIANHRQSRKPSTNHREAAEIAAARRRHREAEQRAEEARRRRAREARELAEARRKSYDDDRHVHEIQSLMMPGYGR